MINIAFLRKNSLSCLMVAVLLMLTALPTVHAQDPVQDHGIAAAPVDTPATECGKLPVEQQEIYILSGMLQVQQKQIKQLRKRIDTPETPPHAMNTGQTPAAINLAPTIDTDVSNTADSIAVSLRIHEDKTRLWTILMIALIGALFLFLSLYSMNKILPKKPDESSADKTHQNNASNIMNIVALHLIVFGTLILVITADVSEQLTAAAGILGALAGYIFRGINDRNT